MEDEMKMRVQVGYAGARVDDSFELDVPEDAEFTVEDEDWKVVFAVRDNEGGLLDSVTINMNHVAHYRVQDPSAHLVAAG